jgi:hypothetical protein
MLLLSHFGFPIPYQTGILIVLQVFCLICRDARSPLPQIRRTFHIRKPFDVADTLLSNETMLITRLSVAVGSNSGKRTEDLQSMRGSGERW